MQVIDFRNSITMLAFRNSIGENEQEFMRFSGACGERPLIDKFLGKDPIGGHIPSPVAKRPHDDAKPSTIFDTAPKQTKTLRVEKRESESWRILFYLHLVPRLISIT